MLGDASNPVRVIQGTFNEETKVFTPDPAGGSGGGGGGTSDATAAKQDIGNSSLATIVARDVDVIATGTISTQNLNPLTGTATANSSVEIEVAGRDTLNIQVVGTYTGALSLQGTLNGTNWVTLSGGAQLINQANGAGSGTIGSATQGIFQASVGGYLKVRIAALAAVTGSASLSLRAVDGNGMVALDAPLPAGTATIGSIAGITTAVNTIETAATSGTTTQVATSTTSSNPVIANTARKAVVIYNSATVELLVAFAATCSATTFVTKILPNGSAIIPRETWAGAIALMLASGAASTAQVTIIT